MHSVFVVGVLVAVDTVVLFISTGKAIATKGNGSDAASSFLAALIKMPVAVALILHGLG